MQSPRRVVPTPSKAKRNPNPSKPENYTERLTREDEWLRLLRRSMRCGCHH